MWGLVDWVTRKCFHSSRRRKAGCDLLLLQLFLWTCQVPLAAPATLLTSTARPVTLLAKSLPPLQNLTSITTRESREIQCLPVIHTNGARGLEGIQVPRRAINGDHLKICSQETTCCTQEMELRLTGMARQDFDRILQEPLNRFKSVLISRTTKFDDFFTELVRNARHNLNEMFTRTYGALYQQNSEIFTELFDDLERYYRGNRANVDLQSSMNRFFTRLFQKMFALLNIRYTYDLPYHGCMAQKMDKILPFGDVVEKLTQQVKKAFIDARTFVQALAIGRDTARAASEISPSAQCTAALTRMMYCPQCRGLQDIKPCSAFCLSVSKSCLGPHIELDNEWNQYIDALLMLADRLRGPINIETVVVPIDVKISEAIMNLQEKGEEITAKVFKDCGQPPLARKVRSVPALPPRRFNTTGGADLPSGPQAGHPITTTSTSLEQLSRDIKEKLGPTKDFWSALPSQFCSDYGKTIKNPVQDDCWNGMAKAKSSASASEAQIPGTKSAKSVEPPESGKSLNSAIAQQIVQLRLVTTKLKQAYNGVDVEWIETTQDDEEEEDEEEENDESSGIGVHEGSGSGDGDVEEPEEAVEEGSGTPPPHMSTPVTIVHEVRPSTPPPAPDFNFDSTTTTHRPAIVTSQTTTHRPEVIKKSAASSLSPSRGLLHSELFIVAAIFFCRFWAA